MAERHPGFEDTAFGWRRVSRVPKALRVIWQVISWPFLFVYRKLRGSPPLPPPT